MKNQFKILCGAVALAMAGQVSADTTWLLNGTSLPNGVTVTGLANTGGTSTTSNAMSQTIETAAWSGQTAGYGGIRNKDNCSDRPTNCDTLEDSKPEHAIDNNQRYDMVLMSFASSVKLSSVNFSYTGKSDTPHAGADSDFTILAYVGNGSTNVLPSQLTNGSTTWSTVGGANSGWTKIGNYADALKNNDIATNANVFSSYWLIGAYNPLAGGTKTGLDVAAAGSNSGSDYLKLASVKTVHNTVPEPGSLALFGIAFLGMLTLRKRQQT